MRRSTNPVHSARQRAYAPEMNLRAAPGPLDYLLTARTQVLDRGFDDLYDAAREDLEDFSLTAMRMREEESA